MVARTVFVTGPDSATVAAATALDHARRGRRTLLLAADDPHRVLDGLLDVRLGTEPVPCGGERLTAARIDGQHALCTLLADHADRIAPALDLIGADPLDPDELTPLPGVRPLALLRALRSPAAGHDVLVVAAPPPADLIDTLALPEQLDRYLARLLPEQRQAARALRPLLAAVAGVPMPADWLFEARSSATAALAEARAAIEAPGVTVRLVIDAEDPHRDELRRIRAGLALHGLRLDAVVAHRALPEKAVASPDAWLAAEAARQQDRLAELAAELSGGLSGGPGCPLLVSRLPEVTLEGVADQLYAAGEPPLPAAVEPVMEDRLAADGLLVWHLPLPGADRGDLELVRRGEELVVGVSGYRRILRLPSALRRCTVAGAALAGGRLSVRFAPDPSLWPS